MDALDEIDDGPEAPYVSTGHLPPAALVQTLVAEAHERFRSNAEGENAHVYPALARVPSELFGICVAGANGNVYAAGDAADAKWRFIHDGLSRFAGRTLSLDAEMYASASATNDRNQSISRLLQSYDRISCDPSEVADLYTKQCSLSVSATDLAVMGATLADGGVNPLTKERVIDADVCRFTLAVMTTAGLYETSGDWLYDIGLPGKSGIGRLGLNLFALKAEA